MIKYLYAWWSCWSSAIEGRFKAFLEGGALGLGAEGLIAGLRVLRGSAKKQLVDEVQLQQAQQTELKGKAYLPPDWLDALGPKLKGRITGWKDKPKTVGTEITEKELKRLIKEVLNEGIF